MISYIKVTGVNFKRRLTTLCREPSFAERQTLGKDESWQRAVSGRLQLTFVSLCRVSNIWHSANIVFAECPMQTLGKAYFYFFYFGHQTFCGVFLHYVDLQVPFWYNYKSVFYNYQIQFVYLNFFGKFTFELQVTRNLENRACKHNTHAIQHKLRPISGADRKLRAPCSLNMTVNLPSRCLKIV